MSKLNDLKSLVENCKLEQNECHFNLEEKDSKIHELQIQLDDEKEHIKILESKSNRLYDQLRCSLNEKDLLHKTISGLKADLIYKNSMIDNTRSQLNNLNLNLVNF